MIEKIKTLQEVSAEINEKIGDLKKFNIANGYYQANLRNRRNIEVIDSKVRAKLSFKGAKQPISFGYFKSKRGYNSKYKNNKDYANHYGEFIGYVLALHSEVPVCKAELAHLSRYYPNIHKQINHGTPIEKDGCITYSSLENGKELEHGKTVIDIAKYSREDREVREKDNDDLEVVLDAIETRTRKFYKSISEYPQDYIELKIRENRSKAIQMMVYDCLYGNNDRHDENWAMERDDSQIKMYPLYDNERVLGLYENQNFIEKALKEQNVEEISEKVLFSRMKIPGERNQHSSYKDVLNYLMNHYKTETIETLVKSLEYNTPDRVTSYLKFCEGLPSCYVDFGTTMYKSRYDFAKNLYRSKTANKIYNKQSDGEIR